MAVDTLYKDRDDRVMRLEVEVRRQSEAYGRLQQEYGEEWAMRRMAEQQYASLKKEVGSQVSGSFSFMNVLRSTPPSTSLGSVACHPPSAKRGRQKEGGPIAPPRDGEGDGGDGGDEGGGES